MPPPLFDVPGWSVPTEPASSSSSKKSKKRKKPHDNDGSSEKLESAQVNLDKLMDSLERTDLVKRPPKKKHKGKKSTGSPEAVAAAAPEKAPPEKAKPKDAKKPSMKPKGTHTTPKEKGTSRPQHPPKEADSEDPNLTTLQNRMKKKLGGARFRWINEMLYKSDSQKAVEMMHEDPSMFQEYHVGFRQQVQSWPANPADEYISQLKACPRGTVIADLGCGDAALARALMPLGLNVLSYDLVPDGVYVTEADICAGIPLPGSEPDKGTGEGHIVDVAVCALGLMGSNWPKCIREAWRVLKPTGQLKIAEVSSRFENVDQFVSLISSVGFKFKSKNESNTHFTTFEFQKIARKGKTEQDWEKVMSKGKILKPCEYKRR